MKREERSKMVYPNFKNKHLEEAFFNPGTFLKGHKFKIKKFPSNIIIVYQNSVLRYFKRKFKGKYITFRAYSLLTVYILEKENIGIIRMTGVGSPNAGSIMEELIALGARKIINMGTAGGLLHEGVFLCNRAVRDEGMSYHYLPDSKYSYPDKKLTDKLGKSLKKLGINYEKSSTWTIDAPYRETRKEVEHYRDEEVATVEMEAAALFAIAKVRKIKIASAFVVSDTLIKKWEQKFHHINVIKSSNKLLEAALDCLKNKK